MAISTSVASRVVRSGPQVLQYGAAVAGQAGPKNLRLVDLYHSYFEIEPAETAEHLRAAFRLRYEVYCVENPFENPENNPNGLETDAYDARSLHSLLRYRVTGECVGTVRLILPSPDTRCFGLPLRDVCDHELLTCENDIVPWARTAEISRFAVSKKLRQRSTDRSVAGGEFPPEGDSRRRIPDTSLGLMQGVIAMAAASGVTHLCAAMEPGLLRMLRRLGMQIPSLGPEVDYHGSRQPCYSHIDTALAKIWLVRPDVWELLTRDGALWPLNTDRVSWLRRRREYAGADAVALKA